MNVCRKCISQLTPLDLKKKITSTTEITSSLCLHSLMGCCCLFIHMVGITFIIIAFYALHAGASWISCTTSNELQFDITLKRKKNMHMGNERETKRQKLCVKIESLFSLLLHFFVSVVSIFKRAFPSDLFSISLLTFAHSSENQPREITLNDEDKQSNKNIKISAFVITSSYMHMINDCCKGWWFWQKIWMINIKVEFKDRT